MEKIFSDQDVEKFNRDGYVVVESAISASLAQELAEVMLDHQKKTHLRSEHDLDEYAGGVVRMVHHPLQWKLRESPVIYAAFCQLLGDYRLWVTFDRGKIVPPGSFGGDLQKGFIHWDINTNILPTPIPLQGLVTLTDAAAGQGGFQCVPGFHREFAEWQKRQPADRDPFRPSLKGLKVVPVEMKAGDLVIWNSLLPHGNGPNTSSNPRIAQIVRMFPCRFHANTLSQRLEMWKSKFPWNHWEEPELSPLGERLVGICEW